MNNLRLLITSVLSLICFTNVQAQNIDHFYGGLGAGQGRAKIDDDRISAELIGAGSTSTSIVHDQIDASYKIFGGYQINSNFGIEAGYFKLGEFGFKSTTIPSGTLNGGVKLEGFNIDLLGYLPITEKLSFLGRIGVANTRARDNFTASGSIAVLNNNPQIIDNNYKAGVGFSYKINQSISVRTEFERYRINDAVGNKGDINIGTISLVFPFGQDPVKEVKVIERVSTEVIPVVVVVTEAQPPIVERIIYEDLPAPVVLTLQEILHVSFSSDILFGFDRSTISPLGKVELDKFSNQLNGVAYDNINIVGHTDRIGPKEYNDKLSLQRANAVKEYFISSGLIASNKLSTIGRGSSQPLTDSGACRGLHSSSEAIACLSSDRRVDVDVVGLKNKVD